MDTPLKLSIRKVFRIYKHCIVTVDICLYIYLYVLTCKIANFLCTFQVHFICSFSGHIPFYMLNSLNVFNVLIFC